MTEVILEREFNPALSGADFLAMAAEAADCLHLYRVQWRESLLALDGKRLVCRFTAPDTESVRMIATDARARYKVAWSGAVHDTARALDGNVVVERRFDAPVDLASLQAIEEAAAWCLEQHRVTFLRTFCAADGLRMLCLYRAPDAESVRLAQQQANMPVERIWAFRGYSMADFNQ
jgi:hypothetical protein